MNLQKVKMIYLLEENTTGIRNKAFSMIERIKNDR